MTLTFESHYFRVVITDIRYELTSLIKHYQGLETELAAIVNDKDACESSEVARNVPGGQYIDHANGGVTSLSPALQAIRDRNLPTQPASSYDYQEANQKDYEGINKATEAQIAQADVDRKEE